MQDLLQPFRGMNRRDVALMLGGAVCFGLILVVESLSLRDLSRLLGTELGVPRQVVSLAMALWAALFSVMSYYRGGRVDYRLSVVVGGAGAATYALAMLQWGADGSAAWLIAALVAYSLAYVTVLFMFACSLVRLASVRAAAVAVMGGIILRQLANPLYAGVQENVAVLISLICAAVIACLALVDRPVFARLARSEGLASVELTNPFASLVPPRRLFLCIFLVSCTYNFSNSLGVPQYSARRVAVVLALLALLYILLVCREGQEDRLFSLVVFFVMAGLLMAPVVLEGDSFLAHSCLWLGSSCFTTLVWLLLYSLGGRNVVSMVPTFGMVVCAEMLGRFVGSVAGSTAFGFASDQALCTQAVILGLALAFFGFIWFCFRDFSFTAAIRGVEASENLEVKVAGDAGVTPGTAEGSPQTGSGANVARLVRDAQLTPREAEIFELLACGRNAGFIMESLGITRNTTKAHISHIYTKLGVHSQQELLSLVYGTGDRGVFQERAPQPK